MNRAHGIVAATLVALLATTLSSPTSAGAGRYTLHIDCTNWCGETKMRIEETIVDREAGKATTRLWHPGEFEKVADGDARSPGFTAGAPGRFQVATVSVGQENQIMVMESILDTATGTVVSRRWIAPRVFELLDTTAPARDPARAATHQVAGATFGEGIRAQDFVAVIDTRNGKVVARTRRDTRSVTRRDAVCLPAEHWIEPAGAPGPFRLSITPRGPDDRRALVYETVLDSRDGSVVARRRVHQRAYRSTSDNY